MIKMSRFAGIMGVLVSMSLLTGCIGQEADPFAGSVEPDPVKPNATEVEVNEPVETEPEEAPVEEEVDYEAVYAPVIEENINMIKDGYDFEKEYQYVSNGIIERCSYGDKEVLISQLGYTITDINSDDVPELLIGENLVTEDEGERSYVYSGYTYKDGELVCFLSGWARSSHIWMGNGKFYFVGSNGAASTLFGQHYLGDNGETLWDDFYFSDEKDDGTIGFFHNKTGVYDINAADELDMEADEFWKLYNDSTYELLKWTPFEEYK